MPPKLKNFYGGGWSEAKKRQLESIVLPNKTRCCECKKLKSINGFSKRQQNEFRHGIARGQVDVDDLSLSWIKCFQCTGAQTHELECCMCGTIKGLDGFTKAQRRNPDSARCLECVADHQEEIPIQGTAFDHYVAQMEKESDDDDDDDDFLTNSHEDSNFEESDSGVALRPGPELTATRLESLNLSTGDPSSLKSSTASKAATTASAAGGANAWQNFSNKMGGTSGQRRDNNHNAYAFRGQGQNHPRSQSTVPSDDDSATTAGVQPSDVNPEKYNTSKFAKVKAAPRAVIRPPPYAGGRVVEDSKYDDDDSDDEFFTI